MVAMPAMEPAPRVAPQATRESAALAASEVPVRREARAATAAAARAAVAMAAAVPAAAMADPVARAEAVEALPPAAGPEAAAAPAVRAERAGQARTERAAPVVFTAPALVSRQAPATTRRRVRTPSSAKSSTSAWVSRRIKPPGNSRFSPRSSGSELSASDRRLGQRNRCHRRRHLSVLQRERGELGRRGDRAHDSNTAAAVTTPKVSTTCSRRTRKPAVATTASSARAPA
jgi:hypothetical protein